MGNLVNELEDYTSNASKEQLDKDWEELKEYNNIGPTVGEYTKISTVANMRSNNNYYNNLKKIPNINVWIARDMNGCYKNDVRIYQVEPELGDDGEYFSDNNEDLLDIVSYVFFPKLKLGEKKLVHIKGMSYDELL